MVFEKKNAMEHKIGFSLQILCETFLILRRICDILSQMYTSLHVKYPFFLSDFNKTCKNSDVSLTVHLSITLANDQLDAQIFNTFITIL
jgi:hypothetical protein